MKLPKRSDEIVAVLERNTCNMHLYHVKKQKIVRRFKLLIDDIFFEADNYVNEDEFD